MDNLERIMMTSKVIQFQDKLNEKVKTATKDAYLAIRELESRHGTNVAISGLAHAVVIAAKECEDTDAALHTFVECIYETREMDREATGE